MTNEEKNKIKENDILEEMEEEIEEIEDGEGNISEEKIKDFSSGKEDEKCTDILARTMADFENYKKRVERDREDTIFFLKQDIFKKILPRIDDLERIVKNTKQEEKKGPLFEGILALQTKFKKDLESFGVKSFESIGKEVNHEKHDVMTTIPGKKEGIIVDEFEKGYLLGERILRHARVVAGAGE